MKHFSGRLYPPYIKARLAKCNQQTMVSLHRSEKLENEHLEGLVKQTERNIYHTVTVISIKACNFLEQNDKIHCTLKINLV